MKTRTPQYRAVWIVSSTPVYIEAFTVSTQPTSYSVAHLLLSAASARGRAGWVEEISG